MRKLPPLAQVRAFEAAARHLSFKQAAAELSVTPTAISHQIRLLEEFCGCALFRRRPRPLRLTAEGAQLFPVTKRGLDEFDRALSSIRSGSRPVCLKITTTSSFASKWLLPRLGEWRQAHADVALDVVGTDALVDLDNGDADLSIRYMKAAPTGLVTRELFRDNFVAVCSPALLSNGEPLDSVSELRGRTLIHTHWSPSDPNAPVWPRWIAAAAATEDEVPDLSEMGHLTFSEELHAIDAAVSGEGVLIVSDILVEWETSQLLLTKALEFSMPGYGFFAAYKPDHPRRAIISNFVEWAGSLDPQDNPTP